MAGVCSAAHPIRFTVHLLEGFPNLPPSGSCAQALQEVSLGAASEVDIYGTGFARLGTVKK